MYFHSIRCPCFFEDIGNLGSFRILRGGTWASHQLSIMSANKDPEKYSLDAEAEKGIPEPLADAIRNGSVDKNILKHSHDADEAMKAFQGAQGQVIEIDAATNKRLLRKIDWNLMPVRLLASPLPKPKAHDFT